MHYWLTGANRITSFLHVARRFMCLQMLAQWAWMRVRFATAKNLMIKSVNEKCSVLNKCVPCRHTACLWYGRSSVSFCLSCWRNGDRIPWTRIWTVSRLRKYSFRIDCDKIINYLYEFACEFSNFRYARMSSHSRETDTRMVSRRCERGCGWRACTLL